MMHESIKVLKPLNAIMKFQLPWLQYWLFCFDKAEFQLICLNSIYWVQIISLQYNDEVETTGETVADKAFSKGMILC